MSVAEQLFLVIKFVALCLLGLRLSWFLIEDKTWVIDVPRAWLIKKANSKHWPRVALFFVCPFCIALIAQYLMVAALSVWTRRVSLPDVWLWPVAINMVTAPLHHFIDARIVNK